MYDLREIKAISLRDVAEKHGIKLEQKGDRLWGKLRHDDKTASFSINIKANLWYDFGSGQGGSVIDLVAELEGITSKEAISRLAVEYGLVKENTKEWRPLTDSQYREIGIQPERATMNFDFDLNRQPLEYVERVSRKYGMPVGKLAAEHPGVYNKLILKIALGNVHDMRGDYRARVASFQDPATDALTKQYLASMGQVNAEEINRRIDLVQRAFKPLFNGQKVDLAHLKLSPEKDFIEKTPPMAITAEDRINIVKAYKTLYQCDLIERFSVEQVVALRDVNRAIAQNENKYLPLEEIRNAYDKLGQRLDALEGAARSAQTERELPSIKALFSQCNTVIEGIREASMAVNRDRHKALEKNRSQEQEVTS